MKSLFVKDTSGTSVIVGAMLLIIITVTAATSVAYIVTSLQQDIAEKESHTTAIELEELEITKISLYPAACIDDFEGVSVFKNYGTQNCYWTLSRDYPYSGWRNTTETMEVVACEVGGEACEVEGEEGKKSKYAFKVTGDADEFINKSFVPFQSSGEEVELSFRVKSSLAGDGVVEVSLNGERVPINFPAKNKWQKNTTSFSLGSESEFSELRFTLKRDGTTIYLDDIKFSNPSYWGEVELAARNLNIRKTTLKEVAVKNHFARTYSVFSPTSKGKAVFTRAHPYTMPPRSTASLRINLLTDFGGSPVHLKTTDPIETLLITGLGSNFADAFAPPVPVARVQVVTEDLGVVFRDFLVLDASESYDPDPDGFVTEFNWTVYYNDSRVGGGETAHYQTGKKVRAGLEGINPVPGEAVLIDLKVTDDTGMVAKLSQISGNISVPASQNFNPPVSLRASYEAGKITVWVNDTAGRPVEGVVVNFVCIHNDNSSNPVKLAQSSATVKGGGSGSEGSRSEGSRSEGSGHAVVTQEEGSGGGTVRVLSGNLPYVDVRVEKLEHSKKSQSLYSAK